MKTSKIYKKDKILACFGHVNMQSAARLCQTSIEYVSKVWLDHGLTYKKRNTHFSLKDF